MGGGDLNTKKSWHPNTIKNQERVWKAEQAEAKEKRRIDDLKREINNERSKEELIKHGQESGALPENSSRKMDWMYKQPHESVDREQYLLGKKIDKTFEKIVSEEKSSLVKPPPKNHVEHECIPFSIRNLSTDVNSREYQVDIARKLMEDPLAAIRQRELESRAQLLQNPVKLKELTMLLRNEQAKKKQKKDKKHKKSSRKSPDIDQKLAEKLNKLKSIKDKDINLEDLLSTNKLRKKSSKKRKSSFDSESEEEVKHKSKKNKNRKRELSESDRSFEQREKSIEPRDRYSKHKDKDLDRGNKSVDSKTGPRDIRAEHQCKNARHRDNNKEHRERSTDHRGRNIEHKDRDKSKDKVSLPIRRYHSDSSDDDKPAKKLNYGLIRVDGSRMELKKTQDAPYKRKSPKPSVKPYEKPQYRTKLTEAEKEEKRKQMMKDATLRDKEREKNVSYYKEQDKRQEDREKNIGYRNDFVEKHLRETSKHLSVESRIKSNVYNIQRSGSHMNANFAKR